MLPAAERSPSPASLAPMQRLVASAHLLTTPTRFHECADVLYHIFSFAQHLPLSVCQEAPNGKLVRRQLHLILRTQECTEEKSIACSPPPVHYARVSTTWNKAWNRVLEERVTIFYLAPPTCLIPYLYMKNGELEAQPTPIKTHSSDEQRASLQ